MGVLEEYFRYNNRGAIPTVALAAGYQQLLPADPMRFAVALMADSTNLLYYSFTESYPGKGQYWVYPGNPPLLLLLEEVGDFIRKPLWASAAQLPATAQALASMYDPNRYDQMQRYINEQLSY